MKVNNIALVFLALSIFGFSNIALAAKEPKYGSLDGNGIYRIELQGEPTLDISFFVPMNLPTDGSKNRLIDIVENVEQDEIFVGFGGKQLDGGGVFFVATPSGESDFDAFAEHWEKTSLENYGREDSEVELIHSQQTRFNGFPAVYRVYKVVTKHTLSYRMQYAIDYGPHFLNIELQTRDVDTLCMEGLSNPSLAISEGFTSANVFFDSFSVMYRD